MEGRAGVYQLRLFLCLLSFREGAMPEAHFPGISALGNRVNSSSVVGDLRPVWGREKADLSAYWPC